MILVGDAFETLSTLPNESVQCCITSPPYYGLRDYGSNRQIGLESTFPEYINNLRIVFEQVRRVLKKDGTLWLNLGDSYAGGMTSGCTSYGDKQATNLGSLSAKGKGIKVPEGLKAKDLIGVPWRVAFALQTDGWYLRQDIIWHKPNVMPESVRDRCTKAHEYIFLLSKSKSYYFDNESIKEPAKATSISRMGKKWSGDRTRGMPAGKSPHNFKYFGHGSSEFRNKRSVWTVTTKPFKGAHFATFPQDLIEPCVLAGSKIGDTILDPFLGSGTTGLVAKKHGRKYIGIELNENYAAIAESRIAGVREPA